MRNFLAAPAALYLAYFLTANVHSSRRFLYIAVAGGLMVSFMIVVFFKEKSVTLNVGAGSSLNEVRGVAYISAYAGLAVALLFYSIASGLKLVPLPLALVLMGACLVGQIATLSRSDWLAAAAGLMAGFALLPKEQRMKSLFRSMIALPFLIASIWIGLYAASQITGKNFFDRMEKRVLSMLPGDHGTGEKHKAWDTRLPGTFRELRMWASSPLIGGGFGIGDTPQMEASYYVGVRHNTWTSTLSETGLLGFAAFGLMAGGCVVIGWRMVKARTDQTTMLIGAFGIITATFFWFHGMATMSFNQVRWGLPFFITAGVLLRTRAMQLTLIRQAQAEQAIEQQGAAGYDYAMDPHDADGGVVQHPALGNWYQTN
jgi:O-antigen ligase